MKHRASLRFWRHYRALPDEIQQLADRGYQMLLQNPRLSCRGVRTHQHDEILEFSA